MSELEFKKLIKGKSDDEIKKLLLDLALKKPGVKETLSLIELEIKKYIDLDKITEADFRALQKFSIPEVRLLFKGKSDSEIMKIVNDISKGIIKPKKEIVKKKPIDIFKELPKKEVSAFKKLETLKQRKEKEEIEKDVFKKLKEIKTKVQPKEKKLIGKDVFDQLSSLVGKTSAQKILSEESSKTFKKLSSLIKDKNLVKKPITPKIKKDAFEQLSVLVGKKSAEKILSSKPETFKKLNKLIQERKLTQSSRAKDTFEQISHEEKKSTEKEDTFKKLKEVSESRKKQKK